MIALLLGCAGGPEGPVPGPADAHCAEATSEPEPRYGAVGDDDACAYRVEYKYARATRHLSTAFDLEITGLGDGEPATDAHPRLDATLDGQPAEDDGAAIDNGFGRYTIDGVVLGDAGRWTLTFSWYEGDGRIAFWFDVP